VKELSWHERGRLWLRLGVRLVLALLGLWVLLALGPTLVSLFAPFLLAFVAAWILSPGVKWLNQKLGLPRKALTLILILLAFAVLFGLLWALAAGIAGEVVSLAGNWESLMVSLQGAMDDLAAAFSRGMDLLPAAAKQTVENLTARLFQWLETVIPRLLSAAADGLAEGVKALPSFAVSTIVFVMAAYFITADYPSLRSRFTGSLPEGPRFFLTQVKRAASAGFGGYVRAEVILSVGVFFILLAGFLLIRQPYAILLAFLLAVLDFVPILGSGTVLVPWAFIDLFLGRFRHAVGLMVVWGVVALFRRVGEPKVLGNQTGLSPILSLVSVYVGMKLSGVLGMVLGPVLCLVVLNIGRAGVFDNILADLRLAAGDISAILRPREES